MSKPTGYILGEFDSPLDGAPLVAIMTIKSHNIKTGDQCQVWIMRRDVNPVEAIETGEDYSICGDCPHRKQSDGTRSCYVNVGQAPLQIYKSYKAGKYPHAAACPQLTEYVKQRSIRWGSYGDPALIPQSIVYHWTSRAKSHTGFTHCWRLDFAQNYKGLFQASCDGFQDYLEATAHGWKTFAVVPKNQKGKLPGKQCPATVQNSQAQCVTCTLCNGAKQNIFVEAHGRGAKYVQLVN